MENSAPYGLRGVFDRRRAIEQKLIEEFDTNIIGKIYTDDVDLCYTEVADKMVPVSAAFYTAIKIMSTEALFELYRTVHPDGDLI